MNEKNYSLSPDERLDYINEELSLIQLKRGLTFGTDAYLLSAFVKEKAGRGADLGSGTGVASLLCLTKNKTSYMLTENKDMLYLIPLKLMSIIDLLKMKSVKHF